MTELKPKPLEGIRVLDLGMAAAGPIAAEYLGVLGADVIKVEQPKGDILRRGDLVNRSYGFTGNNYCKRGISLNLKSDDDRQIALRLVKTADVLMENFRSPEILERLGLGWDVLHATNPRIIYLQSSAYGWGPLMGMPGNDWTTQAFGGTTSISGQPGGAWEFARNSCSLDWFGAHVNLEAILTALYVREKTGKGVRIETAQLRSIMFATVSRLAEYFATGESPRPMGMARPNIVPDQAFATSDGYVTVTAPHNGFWAKLCAAIGRPDLENDPRFRTNRDRVANREALIAILDPLFRRQPSAHWVELLRKADVPAGEFQTEATLAESLMADPQVQAEHLVADFPNHWGPLVTAQPHWRFDKTEARIDRPAPRFAEHQQEIMTELMALDAGSPR
jgi:crotonobetainyl-CoA:carnitine CoA-transferase CaiB-like acyl-CoA transferase